VTRKTKFANIAFSEILSPKTVGDRAFLIAFEFNVEKYIRKKLVFM
jgi:hypothetical protein